MNDYEYEKIVESITLQAIKDLDPRMKELKSYRTYADFYESTAWDWLLNSDHVKTLYDGINFVDIISKLYYNGHNPFRDGK